MLKILTYLFERTSGREDPKKDRQVLSTQGLAVGQTPDGASLAGSQV